MNGVGATTTTSATSGARGRQLACCHGYAVTAGEHVVGTVETPSFAGATSEPDYLIVRAAAPVLGTFRVVPVALVGDVDPRLRRLTLATDIETVARLPEHLPLGRHVASGGT